MTKQQFDAAVKMAKEGTYGDVDDTILDGCGHRDFKPVTVTLDAAAKFIVWQCLCLNGQFDQNELTEMREISRRKWLVCA